MKKRLYGVVFASPQDEEYNGMAHFWTRDAETAYWFSLSRAVDSENIEVMVERVSVSDVKKGDLLVQDGRPLITANEVLDI